MVTAMPRLACAGPARARAATSRAGSAISVVALLMSVLSFASSDSVDPRGAGVQGRAAGRGRPLEPPGPAATVQTTVQVAGGVDRHPGHGLPRRLGRRLALDGHAARARGADLAEDLDVCAAGVGDEDRQPVGEPRGLAPAAGEPQAGLERAVPRVVVELVLGHRLHAG